MNIGDEVIDHFPAFEADGYTKRSGLTAGDFTVTVFLDDTESALSSTISEIGTTGEYALSFTPDELGFWSAQVLIDFNKEIWVANVEVGTSVWDEQLLDHQQLGSTGEALSDASVGGDPTPILDKIQDVQDQVDKIDSAPTTGPAAVTSGSLMDRMMNKDSAKTYNQGTDSLEALRDRVG